MVLGDEAHEYKAKSLTSILEKCTNAAFRIGATGTLDDTQTHQLVLEGLFGKVYKVITTKKLMEDDILAQLQIKMLLLKYGPEDCKIVKKTNYQEEIDFIVRYGPRNNFISNLALDQKGNTLVLFQFVSKHGKPLRDLIEEKNTKNKKIFYISGETPVEDRELVRSITEENNDVIIIASMGTFSTGINIKNLQNIIFSSPSKSQIRVLQSIGRGLRKSPDGSTTTVFDLVDDLSHGNKTNYALKHGGERMKIYNKQEFSTEIHEVLI